MGVQLNGGCSPLGVMEGVILQKILVGLGGPRVVLELFPSGNAGAAEPQRSWPEFVSRWECAVPALGAGQLTMG